MPGRTTVVRDRVSRIAPALTMQPMVDQPHALAAAPQPPQPPPPPAQPSRPAGWSGSTAPGDGPADLSHGIGYAIAAIPLAFALLLELLSHDFLAPLADHRVSLLGQPVGTNLAAAVLLMAILGALAVRYVRSTVVLGVVLILTTSIGLTLVIMGPAVVLIMINLHT